MLKLLYEIECAKIIKNNPQLPVFTLLFAKLPAVFFLSMEWKYTAP